MQPQHKLLTPANAQHRRLRLLAQVQQPSVALTQGVSVRPKAAALASDLMSSEAVLLVLAQSKPCMPAGAADYCGSVLGGCEGQRGAVRCGDICRES